MRIDPYLLFKGRCEKAIAFCKTELGAERQMMMRNAESPELPPGSEQKIKHASMLIGSEGAAASRASRCHSTAPTRPRRAPPSTRWPRGGQVGMPLGKTFWAPLFGMVTDKFGVGWMVGGRRRSDRGAGAASCRNPQ